MAEPRSKPNGIRRKKASSEALDEHDRTLLAHLLDDARQKYAELGAKVHLSAPAVFERVKRLERDGVLRRFTVEIDPAAVGLHVCAFVRVRSRISCRQLAAALAAFPAIEECHAVAGEDCIILKVRVETPAALEELLDGIRAIEGVERTVSTLVLTTHFERGAGFPAARPL